MSVVELSLDGMTCASCANRIEKKLNRIDGVAATVNFATEKARVEFGDDVTPEQLVATVEDAGYQARLQSSEPAAMDEDADGRASAAAADLAGADGAGDRDGDGACAAAHQLAVVVVGAGGAGGGVGRVAVPPGGVVEPAARHRHDGHADLDGNPCGAGVVGLRVDLGHGGTPG